MQQVYNESDEEHDITGNADGKCSEQQVQRLLCSPVLQQHCQKAHAYWPRKYERLKEAFMSLVAGFEGTIKDL